jgi:hypothetical protein
LFESLGPDGHPEHHQQSISTCLEPVQFAKNISGRIFVTSMRFSATDVTI